MPPRTANPNGSPHTRRNEYVRGRVISFLRRSGMEPKEFGEHCRTFAEKSNGDFRWFKNSKDDLRSVRLWLEGKHNWYTWAVDTAEVTVVFLERVKHEEVVSEERMQHEEIVAELESRPEPRSAPQLLVGVDEDEEVNAIRTVIHALSGLDYAASLRVLNYVSSRLNEA